MPGFTNGVRYDEPSDVYDIPASSKAHAGSDAQQALDAANDALLGAKAYTNAEIVKILAHEGVLDITDPAVAALVGTASTATRTQVDGRVTALAVTKAGHDAAAAALMAGGTNFRGALTRTGSLPVGQGEQVVDVRAHGAVGGGVTDDYLAFASAVATLSLGGGGTLLIPPGVYRLSQTLYIDQTITIRGGGPSLTGNSTPTTLKFDAGIDGVHLYGPTATLVELNGFDIISTATGPGPGVGLLVQAGRPRIYRVAVRGFGSHGVELRQGGNGHLGLFDGVTSRGNHGNGFHMTGEVNANTFTGCDAMHNGGWGFYNTARHNVFLHIHCSANGLGAVYDNSTSPFYLMPYVEGGGGDNSLLDVDSHHGVWLAAHYGSNPPVNNALYGGEWTITGKDNRLGLETDAIFIPVGGGMATVGAPTLGNVNRTPVVNYPGTALMSWTLPAVEVPQTWPRFSVHVVWASSSGGVGDCVWRIDRKWLGAGDLLDLPDSGGVATPVAGGAADEVIVTDRDLTVDVESRRLSLTATRTPGSTLPDVNLLGIEIRRRRAS